MKARTNLLMRTSLASIHLPRGCPSALCRSGRAGVEPHSSRRHVVHRTLQHQSSEFLRYESSARIPHAAHDTEFPRGDIAGSAAVTVRRRVDRPGLPPIVHPVSDRLVLNDPAYRYLADEQPPAPASPSALGTAFASLRVADSSWSGQIDTEHIENIIDRSGQAVGVRPWRKSPILSRCRSSPPMTVLPLANPRNASIQTPLQCALRHCPAKKATSVQSH